MDVGALGVYPIGIEGEHRSDEREVIFMEELELGGAVYGYFYVGDCEV